MNQPEPLPIVNPKFRLIKRPLDIISLICFIFLVVWFPISMTGLSRDYEGWKGAIGIYCIYILYLSGIILNGYIVWDHYRKPVPVGKLNYKKVSVELWTEISKENYTYPLKDVDSISDFKNYFLMALGYERCRMGCPLCEVRMSKSDCPLGDCYNDHFRAPCVRDGHPYAEWHKYFIKNGVSKASLARKFLKLLKTKVK